MDGSRPTEGDQADELAPSSGAASGAAADACLSGVVPSLSPSTAHHTDPAGFGGGSSSSSLYIALLREWRFFLCGLTSGVAQAAAFTPVDRALYLSVRDRRPFLHRQNWVDPYQGFLQTIVHRAVSGGLYFPLESLFKPVVEELLRSQDDDRPLGACAYFLAGNAAGVTNALLLHPLATVKYACWGQPAEGGRFWPVVRHIYSEGGVRPFLRGALATVMRDLTFGGLFAAIRHPMTRFALRTEREIKERIIRARSSSPTAAAVFPSLSLPPTTHTHAPASSQPAAAASLTDLSIGDRPHSPADGGMAAPLLPSPVSARHHSPVTRSGLEEDRPVDHQHGKELDWRRKREREREHPQHQHHHHHHHRHGRGGAGDEKPGLTFFVINSFAAMIAVAASSPFNYIRNIKFAIPPGQPTPSGPAILRELWRESIEEGAKLAAERRQLIQDMGSRPPPSLPVFMKVLAQHPIRVEVSRMRGFCRHMGTRLRLGWGSSRVAVGMAFAAVVYQYCIDWTACE
ncbi:unnamed protein product [Vitrella brassicaformis CCMP3155]|uniref:Mitochondrial carrier protein n=3 Tax=Vitrella brassicaformis TaxID=1169539 RepID=A0A0G4GQH0_VITBC|nr:unnamed protein product [Vitrella brassicaformis CCMP3155]|eukprot:CEM32710.1 unnamed protein product [Vitrella brassicaformis CCMP3155]